jgi:galactokinase
MLQHSAHEGGYSIAAMMHDDDDLEDWEDPGLLVRDRVVEAFGRRFSRAPQVLVRAPGRVNLLGAHVDYSEGWVLPAAIDRAVWLAAALLPEGKAGRPLRAHALDLESNGEADLDLDLDALPLPRPQRSAEGARSESSWIDVPAGVAWALAEKGHQAPAMEVMFGSDLPIAAGVSSSAAVEMAFLLAWEVLSAVTDNPFDLLGIDRARIGQRGENGYLGVQSGIMDQFASLHGLAGQAILLDCRDLTFEPKPMPPGSLVLVADSGVRRRLGASGFNDRPAECHQAVEILRRVLPDIRTLRDVTVQDFERHSHHLPIHLRRRAQHTVEECKRVQDGAMALLLQQPDVFGELMRRSHLSSRDLYEVSIPELDVLAASAWSVEGCYGARLSGGGFGGCVTALVDGAAAEAVGAEMTAAFEAEFGRSPTILRCRVAEGARVLPPP